MTEQKRFWILLALFALSIGLFLFLNSSYTTSLGI